MRVRMENERPHKAVMQEEFLSFFADQVIEVFYDGNLGAGGHASRLLESHPEIKTYLGCDLDPEAQKIARSHLARWKEKVDIIHGNFADLDKQLDERKISQVDGFFLTWECRRCS
jgi:16S rRNA (cytosine1402-N4)-methyltransferase